MGIAQSLGLWLAILLACIPLRAQAESWNARQLLDFVAASCRGWEATGGPAPGYSSSAVKSDINFRGATIGIRHRLQIEDDAEVEFDVINRGGRQSRFVGSLFNRFGDPLLLVALDGACEFQVARQISYTDHGQAVDIVSLNAELVAQGEPDRLNPPLEFMPRDGGITPRHPGEASPLRVGMIDSGVNYRLPEINRRLARDRDGLLVGYDFWEMDALPYDANPVSTGFFVQRHGTRTASLLLREAPGIELVPYRYPRPDMSRMQALIEHAAEHGVGILGLPIGSNRPSDWGAFERAARAHPQMLFIVSAGNDGRDIDERPLYPAALDLDNLLVVTSADDFVRPAERTNWGRISVDYMVPAELVSALDYSGRQARVSGSSYAVARVAALAARLKMSRRDMRAADIIAELGKRYGGKSERALDWVSSGYIADPLAGNAIHRIALPKLRIRPTDADGGARLPLEVLVLDPRWARRDVEAAVQAAYDILAQCGISAGDVDANEIQADDYLRDLSTGSARTLLEAVASERVRIVFARDTLMQEAYTGEAFGLGNTGARPWLANSVWLMLDVDDPGIALAHELFHVLANNGLHVDTRGNLMQGRTRPDGTMLSADQCAQARQNGARHGLLIE